MEKHEIDFYGEEMCKIFNFEKHAKVSNDTAQYLSSYPKQWKSFGGSWNAMFWRFRAMYDSSNYSIESILKSTAPNFEDRYLQERHLFEFYSNALSTIEISFYCIYCLASIKDESNFKFDSEKTLSNIRPDTVLSLFSKHYPSISLTQLLISVCKDQNYKDLKKFRDFFSHRGTLNRAHYFTIGDGSSLITAIPSNPKEISTNWLFNIHLNESLIKAKCDWTVKTINLLIGEIEEFTKL